MCVSPEFIDDDTLRFERTDGSWWVVVTDGHGVFWFPGDRIDIRYPGSVPDDEDDLTRECVDDPMFRGTLVWRTTFDPDGEFVCERIGEGGTEPQPCEDAEVDMPIADLVDDLPDCVLVVHYVGSQPTDESELAEHCQLLGGQLDSDNSPKGEFLCDVAE